MNLFIFPQSYRKISNKKYKSAGDSWYTFNGFITWLAS